MEHTVRTGAGRQAYDERGNRASVTAPDGRDHHYTHDAGRRDLGDRRDRRRPALPLQRGGAAGLESRIRSVRSPIRLDPFGRTPHVTDPIGETTRWRGPSKASSLSRIDPDGATEAWTYDGEDNRLSHTDAVGASPASNTGTSSCSPPAPTRTASATSSTHDTELRLTRVTNPQGLTWNYDYDAAGRLVAETDFDDRTLTYTHDAAGHLALAPTLLGETDHLHPRHPRPHQRKDAAGSVTTVRARHCRPTCTRPRTRTTSANPRATLGRVSRKRSTAAP